MWGLCLPPLACAALWTGLVTTALNRLGENVGLGRVSAREAAVLVATEPIWAALFAGLLVGEGLTGPEAAGGALIMAACLVNALGSEEEEGAAAPAAAAGSTGETHQPEPLN